MGFLTNLISATVKTALMPVTIVKDVVDVSTGKEAENTSIATTTARISDKPIVVLSISIFYISPPNLLCEISQ